MKPNNDGVVGDFSRSRSKPGLGEGHLFPMESFLPNPKRVSSFLFCGMGTASSPRYRSPGTGGGMSRDIPALMVPVAIPRDQSIHRLGFWESARLEMAIFDSCLAAPGVYSTQGRKPSPIQIWEDKEVFRYPWPWV